jgi:hypothetical protein
MRGILKLRIHGHRRHRMAGCAQSVGRSNAIDLGAGNDSGGADYYPQRDEAQHRDPSSFARRDFVIRHYRMASLSGAADCQSAVVPIPCFSNSIEDRIGAAVKVYRSMLTEKFIHGLSGPSYHKRTYEASDANA